MLYTDATRALYRTRAELLVQNHRKLKSTVRAEKRGGKLAAPSDIPVGISGHSGCDRLQERLGTNVRAVNTTVRRKAERHTEHRS